MTRTPRDKKPLKAGPRLRGHLREVFALGVVFEGHLLLRILDELTQDAVRVAEVLLAARAGVEQTWTRLCQIAAAFAQVLRRFDKAWSGFDLFVLAIIGLGSALSLSLSPAAPAPVKAARTFQVMTRA